MVLFCITVGALIAMAIVLWPKKEDNITAWLPRYDLIKVTVKNKHLPGEKLSNRRMQHDEDKFWDAYIKSASEDIFYYSKIRQHYKPILPKQTIYYVHYEYTAKYKDISIREAVKREVQRLHGGVYGLTEK